MTGHRHVEGIQIKPDKTTTPVTLKRYQDYRECVQGMIEGVRLATPTTPRFSATMYVNEEFLLGQFGPEDFNSIATDLAGFCGRPDLLMGGILGPVVVVGDVDPEGYDQDIPQQFIQLIEIIRKEADAGNTLNENLDLPIDPTKE